MKLYLEQITQLNSVQLERLIAIKLLHFVAGYQAIGCYKMASVMVVL